MKALTCGILSTLFQLKFRQLLWCNSDIDYIGSVVFYRFYKFIRTKQALLSQCKTNPPGDGTTAPQGLCMPHG